MDGASLLRFQKPPLSSYFPNRHCLLLPPSSLPLPSSSNRRVSSVVRAESQAEKPKTSSDEGSVSAPPPTKPTGSGAGFGGDVSDAKKKRGSRDRGSVIRRSPIERPEGGRPPPPPPQEQQNANESAFLLTWLGLGSLILVEGLALAASGFLPEEWDSFFVKYLYPSFTPTVFLFVVGTVTYGVLKYLQGEQMKS